MNRRRACGKCGKRFLLSKQLVEILKKEMPKATDFDFLSCGTFHRRLRSAFVCFPSFDVEVGENFFPGSPINDDWSGDRLPVWRVSHLFPRLRRFRQDRSGTPASGPALQDVAVMEQSVEHRGDGSGIAE